MARVTSPDNEAVEYRYFVCDLLTNELLVEIPFKSVSYSRSLVEAGRFDGDIAITEETYNLSVYENTLPGKRALYIVRNGVCVWGGIIWARSYSLIDKLLSVSASEFTSYLSHRVVWKTWNSAYEAEAVVASGTATVTLTDGQYDFQEGELVWIDWGPDFTKYNGYFAVESVSIVEVNEDDKSQITVDATYVDQAGNDRTIPDMVFAEVTEEGVATTITVETRQDTYEYAKDLMQELVTDLFDFDFANDLIRPGIDLFNPISSVSRSGNVATVTTSSRNELSVGQRIQISDVYAASGFNDNNAVVRSIIDDYNFTYENTGSNVGTTSTSTPTTATITAFARSGNIATYTTSSAHGLNANDIIFIEHVSETFDGYFTVYDTPTTTTFRAVMFGADIIESGTDTTASNKPEVSRTSTVIYGTFGEHTVSGDLGFDFSDTPGVSGNYEANPIIRGFELKTVAEVLEEYSTKPNGFEYRIDCVYDSTSSSFKKYFKFLPLIPAELSNWLAGQVDGYTGAIPASAYGADNLIFEYPGNILEANFEETSEDSATRFFVQGKSQYLSSEASQPYSGATNHNLLNTGWPLLDAVDDLDSDDETVLWKQASRLLSESVPPISAFTISINGSAHPKLGTYSPGNWCTVKLNDDFVSLRAQSGLEQDYGTDDGTLVRKILSYSVTVPDTPSYPEEVQLDLVTEPAIPLSGVQIIDGKAFI